jgi:hypothetical protein
MALDADLSTVESAVYWLYDEQIKLYYHFETRGFYTQYLKVSTARLTV